MAGHQGEEKTPKVIIALDRRPVYTYLMTTFNPLLELPRSNPQMKGVTCPYCGLEYKDFHTGYTFQDVYDMYWSADPDPATWNYKRRNTILGQWHELKIALWGEHIYAHEHPAEKMPEVEQIEYDESFEY